MNSFAQSLRLLADFYDEKDFSIPTYASTSSGRFVLTIFAYDAESFKSLAKQLGGERTKHYVDGAVEVRRTFGDITLEVHALSGVVCTPIIKEIRRQKKVEVEIDETEIVKEIVGWNCDNNILGETDGTIRS